MCLVLPRLCPPPATTPISLEPEATTNIGNGFASHGLQVAPGEQCNMASSDPSDPTPHMLYDMRVLHEEGSLRRRFNWDPCGGLNGGFTVGFDC